MNLDDRARQASSGLKAAVAGSTLTSPIPGSVPWAWVPRVLSAIGAAAVVVVIALLTIQVAPQTPVADTQPPDGTVIPDSIVPRVDELTTTTVTSSTTSVAAPIVDSGAAEPATEVADTDAPPIVITFPANGQSFDEDVIRFTGTTEPGAAVMAGPYAADVDVEGNWSIVLILSNGSNRAVLTASDEAGNESTADVTVVYTAPVTTTTTTKEETTTTTKVVDVVEFTASQVYGSCAESPPFDVFYGTAQPGTKIRVTSDFGGGFVYANDDGNWEIHVEFPDAPPSKGFLVTVKSDATGQTKNFEFAYLP